jgi:Immunity protein 51
VEHGDTRSLIFNDFDSTADTFEELGQDGGGYGWHGVVDALIRMKAPKLKRKLHFDPEASLFAVNSKDQDALKQVAELIREAINSPELLREAIQNADPELMD